MKEKEAREEMSQSRPKIVVLDGFPTNPGDLSWEGFKKFGELVVYERCPDEREEIMRRSKDASIIVNNKVVFTADMLEELPKLRLIAMQATGYNNVDVEAAARLGIAVCNVPGYSTDSVAQLVFTLILEFFFHVPENDRLMREGLWHTAAEFATHVMKLRELAGRTLGLFGFGSIGRKVGEIGHAFGMKVIYHSRTKKDVDWAEYVSLEELFKRSDVLSLHAPLTPETKEVVNRKTLSLMKPTAIFINTARGGHMNEPELAEALNRGIIAGAGIDVFTLEPPGLGNPLLSAKNCLLTPHIAWATYEARKRLMQAMEDNVRCFLEGRPQNKVN